MTERDLHRADEMFNDHALNTRQIATLLRATETEVERALHRLWDAAESRTSPRLVQMR